MEGHNHEMGRQRSYTTGALNTRNMRLGSTDMGRGGRGMRECGVDDSVTEKKNCCVM